MGFATLEKEIQSIPLPHWFFPVLLQPLPGGQVIKENLWSESVPSIAKKKAIKSQGANLVFLAVC